MGSFLGLESQQVLAVEGDASGSDLVGGMTHDDIAERALARSVESHNGMHFPVPDGEVHALQYFLAIDAGMQVFYL